MFVLTMEARGFKSKCCALDYILNIYLNLYIRNTCNKERYKKSRWV